MFVPSVKASVVVPYRSNVDEAAVYRDSVNSGVVVETTLPLALTARYVLARPVNAKFVVVAFVVVEFPNVWPPVQVFALPRFKLIVLVVEPL